MRELKVDWSALYSAFQMAMPEVRCFLSLEDGSVLKVPVADPQLAAIRTEPNRYLPLEAIPSRIQYQWVDEFAKTIPDDDVRARVETAINGKGAFRRFKDILLTMPDERRRWFDFRDSCMRVRICEWVREKGIDAVNPPPWSDEAGSEGTTPANQARDVEALRDLLIAWAEGKDARALAPLELEKLAEEIAEKFRLEPL